MLQHGDSPPEELLASFLGGILLSSLKHRAQNRPKPPQASCACSHRRVFAHPLCGLLQPRHVDDMVDGVKDALGVLPRQLCYPFNVCVDVD